MVHSIEPLMATSAYTDPSFSWDHYARSVLTTGIGQVTLFDKIREYRRPGRNSAHCSSLLRFELKLGHHIDGIVFPGVLGYRKPYFVARLRDFYRLVV